MTRHDPLLDRPGPMRATLQQFLIVVRLDDERVHEAKAFHQHLGCVTKISDESEPGPAGVKSITDRFHRIVWDRKRLHGDVANRELRAGPEEAPVPMGRERPAADCFRGKRVAINRHVKFPAEHLKAANVVAMFVGQEHAIELSRRDAAKCQTIDQLARA